MKCERKHNLRASVTLEAALVMPVFLYFLVNIMTLFDIVRIQTSMDAALHQAGREIGIYAFDAKFAAKTASEAGAGTVQTDEGAPAAAGAVLSAGYASGRVRDYMERFCPNSHCVVDGPAGIRFLRSDFTAEGDIIDLVASCRVQPLIKVFGFERFSIESRYYGHAWTGYHVPGTENTPLQNEEEETVYMTKTGTVYHRSAECTYLNPSARSVASEDLRTLRNDSGGKYYPCEVCGGGTGGNVIITTYGDRYHASGSCSALARTVRAVPVSEAAGYRACSKCGGKH